jgi:hypothetical protein
MSNMNADTKLDLFVWVVTIALIVVEFFCFRIVFFPTIIVVVTAWSGGVAFRGLDDAWSRSRR